LPRPGRLLRVAGLLLLGFAALLTALALGRAPAVAPRNPPSSAELAAGEEALRQIQAIRESGRGTLRLDATALDGLAAIASRAGGIERFRLDLRHDRVVAAGSHELGLGLWANFAVTALADGPGPPRVAISLGRVTLPGWATPIALKAVRRFLKFRGAEVPPLDDMVRTLAVNRGGLAADVRLPSGTGLTQALAGLRPAQVEGELVRRAWCRLGAAQRQDPQSSLTAQVRRAFSDSAATPEANRAAMVALAMVAVDVRVGELVGLPRAQAAACAPPAQAIHLAGREDLAKHWTLSAALAAALGFEAAAVAGQYKELADAGTGGSGFSFVDLAADRAGLRAARSAFGAPTSARAARFLATAGEEDLLPSELLTLPEGLSDARFAERYGSRDDDRYRSVVRTIDAAIERRWRAAER
jgi:hypothetical protein